MNECTHLRTVCSFDELGGKVLFRPPHIAQAAELLSLHAVLAVEPAWSQAAKTYDQGDMIRTHIAINI